MQGTKGRRLSWGFQAVIVQPNQRRVTGIPGQTWELPSPVGRVRVVGNMGAADLKESGELTFFGSGYPTQSEAEVAGRLFRSWLAVASAVGTFGFDLGNDNLMSWLTPEAAEDWEAAPENAGRFLARDVHGLEVFEERARRFGRRFGQLSWSSSSLTGCERH